MHHWLCLGALAGLLLLSLSCAWILPESVQCDGDTAARCARFSGFVCDVGAGHCVESDSDEESIGVSPQSPGSDGSITTDFNGDGVIDLVTPQGMHFLGLANGTFEMGCTEAQELLLDQNCWEAELPGHSVTLSRDFWMSQTEVTQAQWQLLFEDNPFSFTSCGTDCPVEHVTWYEALAFANAVSAEEGLDECYLLDDCSNTPGNEMVCDSVTITSSSGSPYDCTGYRLATEAEWEYAARAGTDLLYAGSNTLDDVAWYGEKSGGSPQPVASKQPNAWGLHDMSGNVAELLWDWIDPYSAEPSTDPEGPSTGINRAARGGGWSQHSMYFRSSARAGVVPGLPFDFVGFRLVRTAP